MNRLVLLALLSLACPRPVPPVERPEPVDAAVEQEDGPPSCRSACRRLRQLGCPAGLPTPLGEPCEVVCQAVQASGLVVWDLSCRSTAGTCRAVDACED